MNRILPFIALIFAIAIFFVYVRPTYNGSIATTSQKIKSYDAALAAADRFQEKEAELTAARAQISPESLARLQEFLPDGVDNVQLILDLDALAARSGITLSDFDVDNTNASAGSAQQAAPAGSLSLDSSTPVDSLDLTFKATGTYAAFRTFLGGMENSLRPLDIVNLDVSESATGVYNYSVTVRLYWLR